VANLPFSVDDTSIQATFAACGTITGTDWLSHSDTGRFKGAGFLTFETGAAAAAAVLLNGQDNGGRPMKVEIAAARAEKKTWEAEDLGEPSASLFLGNLSWSIDEDSIRKLFEGCGEIQRIKWHEREGQFTGKAFLDFDSVDSATKAAAKSGQDLKGRPVRITFSKGGNGGAAGGKGAGASGRVERPYKPEGAKPDGCVELFCGNLPWSIDDDKITDFFKDCGTVTATRWLNDKETGDFKGVGWVTFSSTEEVDKAVEMGGEQLDGRPIRIDYAGQKKAAAAWGGGGSW
jgi:nucleolin